MNKRFDDGGPAFPVNTPYGVNRGMPRRTYIAVEAMKSLLSSQYDDDLKETVDLSYQIADAMIAAQGDAT